MDQSLGGRLGKETTIMYLSSAAKVLDPNGPAVESRALSTVSLLDAAQVLIDCERESITLGIPTSDTCQELIGYAEVLSGQKGNIGKGTIYGPQPPRVFKVRLS